MLLTRRMTKVYQGLTALVLPLWVLILRLPSASTTVGSHCNNTVATPDGRMVCVWLENKPATWQDADDRCSRNGGFLIPVTSSAMNDVIQSMMVNNQLRTIWLGLRESFSTWRWLSDGKEVTHQGCFLDNPRDRDLDVSTGLGENNTYEACIDHCLAQNYRYAGVQARTECWCGAAFGRHGQSQDCDLLCPTTNKQTCGGLDTSVILVSQGVYSDWQRGQPNNHQHYQTCAAIDSYKDEYQWNDLKCTEPSGVVCEVELNQTECLSRRFLYDSIWGCFVVNNRSRSFFRSREFCHRHGGRMLTLQSREKRDFFVRHLNSTNYRPSNFYIGLVRGRWQWVTGEDLIYSSWESGRPNGANQECATTSVTGAWNDVDCQGQSRYFCLKDPLRPRTTPPPVTTGTMISHAFKTPTTTTEIPSSADGFTKWEITKYSLIGAGTFFGFVLLMIVVCIITFRSRKKKATSRYDYFYGQEEKPQLNGEVNGGVNVSADYEMNGGVNVLADDEMSNSSDGDSYQREVQAPDFKSVRRDSDADYIDNLGGRGSLIDKSIERRVIPELTASDSDVSNLSVQVPGPDTQTTTDIDGTYVTVTGDGGARADDSPAADSDAHTDRDSFKNTNSWTEGSSGKQSMGHTDISITQSEQMLTEETR